MSRGLRFVLVFTFCLFSGLQLHSQAKQGKNRIKIRQADRGYYKSGKERVNRLIGNVIFEHEGALLYCDSAWLYADRNLLEAFENVHIIQDDTINLYSNYLRYEGNTRIAEADGDVKLQDPDMTLTTDHLDLDRNTNVAIYLTGGTIVNDENTLRSKIGRYYANRKLFIFNKDVELENERYNMFSDTLLYQTDTRISTFHGPTRIISDSSRIYCENGRYDTRTDKAQFNRDAEIWDKHRRLTGDSLYYDKLLGFGQAFGHVALLDTVERSLITGSRGQYSEYPEGAAVGGEPLYTLYDDTDSLHIHGDSIYYSTDSSGVALLKVFHRVRIFRSDMQGVCDSLTYSTRDSTFRLFVHPALWSVKSQMTGDTILLEMRDQKMDSLKIIGNAFVLSIDTLDQYNQVRGKRMKGNFKDGELWNMYSFGNGQTVYYAQEEDGDYIGLSRTDCSNIKMQFRNSEVKRVTFLVKPTSNLYPLDAVPEGERQLKGFEYRFDERPKNKASVFD